MGYHKTEITRGEFGELSKIFEELEELVDASDQGVKILALCEVADLVGAIEGYVKKHYPGISFDDVIQMKDCTARAFEDGTRK